MTFDHEVPGALPRCLSDAIFTAFPQLGQHALVSKSGETDDPSLVLTAPSPSGDAARQLTIWVDEVGTPGIEFGPMHTHEDKSDAGIAAIIDRARAILDGRLVIIEDVGGACPGFGGWIDLRQADASKEELTSPYSPGRALLKSWSGASDRSVSTENLPG